MAAEEFSNLSKAHRGVCCIDRIQTPTTASWHFTDMLIIAGFQTASEVCGLGPVALMKGAVTGAELDKIERFIFRTMFDLFAANCQHWAAWTSSWIWGWRVRRPIWLQRCVTC